MAKSQTRNVDEAEKVSPVELEEGDEITAWVTSNTTEITEISGEVTEVRAFGDDLDRVIIETEEGERFRVYYPGAHLEDITSGVKSVGRVTDWYVHEPEEIRTEAEISDDGLEVLPPEVQVRGEVPEAVIEALESAVGEEPNAVDEPILWERGSLVRIDHEAEHVVAQFTATFNELPETGENGELLGWNPRYIARERLGAALREALGDGLAYEEHDGRTFTIYGEGI